MTDHFEAVFRLFSHWHLSRTKGLSMTEKEFLRLLRFYLACLEAEDRCSLTKKLSTLHHSLVSPWDKQELLFYLEAPEVALVVNLRSDLELLRSGAAIVTGAEHFYYGYPIFLDQHGFLSPLFFTEVEVVHAEDCRFVLRSTGALQVNHHVFKRHQTSLEELRAIRTELECQYGSFAMRLHAAFEALGLPMPAFVPDRLEPFPEADSPTNRWVNRPILFKSERSVHTHHLRRELEAMAQYPRLFRALRATAAGVISGIGAPAWASASGRGPKRPQLLQVVPLNRGQENAAQAALRASLAVVTGPPGTGKSQMVVDLLASCALAGSPVLFSSKNNKAVDVVHDRLRAVLGRDQDWTLRLGAGQTMAASRQEMAARLRALRPDMAPAPPSSKLLGELSEAITRTERRIQRLEGARSECTGCSRVERLAAFAKAVGAMRPVEPRLNARQALAAIANACGRLVRLLRLRITEDADNRAPEAPGKEESADILPERLHKLQQRRAELTANHLGATWTSRVARKALLVRHTLGHYFDLSSKAKKTRGHALSQILEQFKDTVRVLGQDLPIWIVTNLSVRNALPLEPGLFELVILDEASQCDIPSALPLLFRARRVLVIGDPRQLRHISTLSSSEEESLATEYDVVRQLATWSYTDQSFYALAERTVIERGEQPLFLAEHYRCHPEIIEFSNRTFYRRRLIVRTAVEKLRQRLGSEPLGLHWHDVRGAVPRSSRSAINDLEVRAVLDLLDEWWNTGFLLRGNVDFGIVTPFRLQMERIDDAVRARPWGKQVKDRLTVGTAHKFQGDERDVMIFSPVVAEGMPTRLIRWVADTDQLLNVAITRARAALHVVGDLGACIASGGFLGDFAATVTNHSQAHRDDGRPPSTLQGGSEVRTEPTRIIRAQAQP
jgi:hypothetical protein